jgi:hypothetical protein
MQALFPNSVWGRYNLHTYRTFIKMLACLQKLYRPISFTLIVERLEVHQVVVYTFLLERMSVTLYLEYHSNRKGRPGDQGSIPSRGKRIFPLTSVPTPALESTQLSVQWVPAVLSAGVKCGRGVILTTHPNLVPRS